MKVQIALLCLTAMALGALGEHFRVKSFDTLWSICYQWKSPTLTTVEPNPNYNIGSATVMKVQNDPFRSASSGTTSNVLKFAAVGPQAGMVIKSGGTADVYGRDGKLIAVLYRDGFVDYRVESSKVVHALADLSARIASDNRYQRWTDAILPMLDTEKSKKEEWK